jgi:hypothetical protein
MMDDGGIPQEPIVPIWADALDMIPGVATTTGWNLGRVSKTITHGGTSGRLRRRVAEDVMSPYNRSRGLGGMLRGGTTQTFGPRHLRRFTRAANIDATNAIGAGGRPIYSPFNSLSWAGNKLFDWGGKNNRIRASDLGGKMSRFAGDATGGEKAFAPGTLGRIMTMRDISGMSARKFAGKRSNIEAAIHDLHPKYYNETFKPNIGSLVGESDEAMRFGYRSGIGSTINSGRISGKMAGYIQGAEAAAKGESALMGARATATGHFAEGIERGAEAYLGRASGGFAVNSAGEAVAARTAPTALGRFVGSGAATGILKGVSVGSWVLLAHDLALGTGKMIGRGIKTGIEAAQSVKGSLDKPVMGMGFKDNTVASTSRQRGVAAIANSRLNARSMLGSEASMMSAHFG